METLAGYLAEHPFFTDLNPEHIELIVGCASNVRFDADEYIFKEGQQANEFYVIRHGRISLEVFHPTQGALSIQTVGAGEVLGWSWLIPPYNWHFDAKALELTRAIALDGKCLRSKCEDDRNLGYELLKRFSNILMDRLQATRLQLLDLYNDTEVKS